MKGSAPVAVRDVLRLAWPSVLSFVCNSAYRVNDQYWVGDLGAPASAALGASVFLLVLNFSFFFLAVSGAMPLIARATGSGDDEMRDSVVRHSLILGSVIAIVVGAVGATLSGQISDWLGLEGETATLTTSYLRTIYLGLLPLALAPIVDTTFIGMGNTIVPLCLQAAAVVLNFVLNPCLIYGWGPFEAHGIAGAAIATCASRTLTVVAGLAIMRFGFGVRWTRSLPLRGSLFRRIGAIGLPGATSITIYALVYFAIIRTVLTRLGDPVVAGLGIGFNAFEGVAFPFYLGVAVAGSSLVGRNLGAGAPDLALIAVRNLRRIGCVLGAAFGFAFLFLGPPLATHFSPDADVVKETVVYVRILALSQVFVAIEAVNEKVLMGSGHTKPIFWISVPGNLLRIPLGWWLAHHLGWGALGMWWAINVTTTLKAGALYWVVQRRTWLTVPAPAA